MRQNKKNNFYCRLLTIGFLATSITSTGHCLASDSNAGLSVNTQPRLSLAGDVKGIMLYSDADADTDFFTRLRLQPSVNIAEHLELTGRINASKSYNVETPDDDDLHVDRLYFRWSDISGTPFWLSGGRLPTMGETSPSHLRLGLDHANGALSPFMDIALDGAAVGYGYQGPFPGKIALYYASQYDAGYEANHNNSGLVDTHIYGFTWGFVQNDTRSLALQSFLFADLRNIPDGVAFPNPIEFANWLNGGPYNPLQPNANNILDRATLGDIYQTSLAYVETFQSLHLFVNLGWSHTDPKAWDELGTSLLTSWGEALQSEDGFCIHAGLRYDLDSLHSRIGFEYNHGSENWNSFSQNMDTAKLSARGSVAEAYWTFAPPLPLSLSRHIQSMITRIGYQYYDYEYTGSGFWLGAPVKIKDLHADPLSAQFYTPLDTEYKIYAAVEIYF